MRYIPPKTGSRSSWRTAEKTRPTLTCNRQLCRRLQADADWMRRSTNPLLILGRHKIFPILHYTTTVSYIYIFSILDFSSTFVRASLSQHWLLMLHKPYPTKSIWNTLVSGCTPQLETTREVLVYFMLCSGKSKFTYRHHVITHF